jgi:hypothetical protein
MNLYFEVLGEINKMSEILDYKRSHCPLIYKRSGCSHVNGSSGPVACAMRGCDLFGMVESNEISYSISKATY